MDDQDLYALILSEDISREVLADYLQQLASYHFDKFIFLLYRLDIEEARTRRLIAEGDDVYYTLAGWIMDKLESRKKNRNRFTYPDREEDEGRW